MRTFTNLFKTGLVILLLSGGTLSAQDEPNKGNQVPSFPLKYGNDIIINNAATEDQQNMDLAIAFNGWLYSAYTANTATAGGYSVRVSKDNGITWSNFHSFSDATRNYKTVKVMAVGSDTTSLQIYVLFLYESTADNSYYLAVGKYDKDAGFITTILSRTSAYAIYDADMANDFENPSDVSVPYSVGILYSKSDAPFDSVIYECSIDGGTTMTIKQSETTSGFYGKVALSYGISSNNYYGRYFIAYEQKDSYMIKNGHIYYAYNMGHVNANLSVPQCLDSISGIGTINLCSDPTISVQQNSSVANDSGGISVVVLFTRDYNGTNTDNDVHGYFNHNAVYAPTDFTRFVINNSLDNCNEPFISYDRVFNNFLVTYHDSTTHQLPYTVKYLNLASPDSWGNLTAAYNDQPNTTYPNPVVRINHAYNQVGFVWSANVSAMGQAMFDAEYSTFGAGISDGEKNSGIKSVYPNPNNGNFMVAGFSNEDFTLEVFNVLGVSVYSKQFSASPEFKQSIDLGEIGSGQYFLRFVTSDNVQTFQIVVQ
jgi:hypothetical protein